MDLLGKYSNNFQCPQQLSVSPSAAADGLGYPEPQVWGSDVTHQVRCHPPGEMSLPEAAPVQKPEPQGSCPCAVLRTLKDAPFGTPCVPPVPQPPIHAWKDPKDPDPESQSLGWGWWQCPPCPSICSFCDLTVLLQTHCKAPRAVWGFAHP